MGPRRLFLIALCVQAPALIALVALAPSSAAVIGLAALAGTAIAWRLAATVRPAWQGAERDRRESEERYRAVTELTGAGVWLTDEEGLTVSVDQSVRRKLGYRPSELAGRPLADFVAGKKRAGAANGNGHPGIKGEVELRRRNGKKVGARLSSITLADGSGTLTVVAESAGRKQAEAETELLKNEFFALISHELRTPLTSMTGYLALITETQSKRMNKEGREFLDVIHRNTDRLSNLLADLMLLTQVEAGTFAMECDQTNLAVLARSSIEEARPAAEKADIDLRLKAGDKVMCWADGNRIGQVLDNLILNAIKFTQAGGHVAVAIETHGGKAVIEVADDGPGIPAGEHKQMFGRFYRGSDARARQVQGLGLGLAITKAIVDAHDGQIGLTSEGGEGTTFTVKLPRSRPAPGSRRWAQTSSVRRPRLSTAV